jgi:hypothetical protein
MEPAITGALAAPPFGSIERFPAVYCPFDRDRTIDLPADF